ncbi:hypothetical protein RN001_007327 [Aquatica leii]|uniref:Tr-type G domain-containing protein n=1 Tax=Aquatica leii TaxID=1421715 RepID=A0AAN7S921_9COLE|nr:hypothetical protein RN001_007327 [Aquatica leii]
MTVPCVPHGSLMREFWHADTERSRYANAKIYKCDNPKCPRPACFISGGSSKDDSFPCLRPNCTGRFHLVRHVSFVDCPGHDILMATMLNGAAVMDAALLLIAGNESCPQPQTSEHLAAIEIMKLKNILILQNKIDLVKEGQAKEQHEQIAKFVQVASTLNRARETNELRQDASKRCSHLRHREVAPYEPGDKVLVDVHALSDAAKGYTSKFAPRRDEPYLIKTQCSPTTYKIASASNPNEIIGSYHVSALRPFVEDDNNDEVFAPIRPIRRRGRPKIHQEVIIKQPDTQPVTAAPEVVTTVKSRSNGRPVRRRQPKQPCVGECCRTSTTNSTSFDSSSTTNQDFDVTRDGNINNKLDHNNSNLPIDSVTDLQKLEEYLDTDRSLSFAIKEIVTSGGKNVYDLVYKATQKLVTNKFAAGYSYFGRGKKLKFFSLKLNGLLMKAALKIFLNCSEKEAEVTIAKWLRRCAERVKKVYLTGHIIFYLLYYYSKYKRKLV